MSNDNTNFPYDASRPATILFAVLFGLALVAHIIQAIWKRCRYLIPLIIATSLEFAGYIFRYYAIELPTQEWPIIISQVFIVVAPAFLAANEYMIFGRIMGYIGSEHGFVPPTMITKIFVALDIGTILAQAAGASMLNGNDTQTLKIGRLILIISLAAQVGSFAIFMILAIAFDVRTRRRLGSSVKVVHPLMKALYASGTLIIIRSTFRTIEFSQIHFTADDATGYVVNHEWLFYVFDSLLMLAATVMARPMKLKAAGLGAAVAVVAAEARERVVDPNRKHS